MYVKHMELKIDAEPHPNAKHARLKGDLVSMRHEAEKEEDQSKVRHVPKYLFPTTWSCKRESLSTCVSVKGIEVPCAIALLK